MNKQEKILLLELIMKDIRGNWGYALGMRVKEAKRLAKDLSFDKQLELLNDYEKQIMDGCKDGRYLRDKAERGGYQGMEEWHSLKYTFEEKSDSFKKTAKAYLTNPEYRFKDWN